ncbi:hypothetical protein COCNU_scaffold010088G000070 [Cocos nucifera]|nr:hypothetical protein [Cocos nucifera]
MDRAGESSSGSDSSAAAAAAEDYVHVSSADPPVAVAAAEQPALNPNSNPNICADPELPEAPAWSSIEEKACASVAADDEVLGGLGGPDVAPVGGAEERKRVLSEELSKGVVILECESSAEGGTCDVYLVADKLEVFPGSEFRVAFEEAMSYGAKVILGDRPVHVKHLLEVPAKGAGLSRIKILASLGVAVTGVALASGLYLMGKR